MHMTRLLLTTLLSILCTGPAYAEWVYVTGDDETGSTIYVDPDTIRRNGNLVKMWDLRDRKTMEGYGSIKSQFEYDCAEDRQRKLASLMLSGHMGRGKVIVNSLDEGKWNPIVPDSVNKTLWKYACDKK